VKKRMGATLAAIRETLYRRRHEGLLPLSRDTHQYHATGWLPQRSLPRLAARATAAELTHPDELGAIPALSPPLYTELSGVASLPGRTLLRVTSNLRQEPYAVTRSYGSVRGAVGNHRPYRDHNKSSFQNLSFPRRFVRAERSSVNRTGQFTLLATLLAILRFWIETTLVLYSILSERLHLSRLLERSSDHLEWHLLTWASCCFYARPSAKS
jgi:hypothetical protein